MSIGFRDRELILESFTTSFMNMNTRLAFLRSVYLYFILKIIFAWQASLLISEVLTRQEVQFLPLRVLFAPQMFFENYPEIFLISGLILCGIGIWKPNYISGVLLSWFVINYFRSHHGLTNGSDVVLITWIVLGTGLCINPVWKKWTGIQMLVFNGSSLLIRIQFAIIYLLSGVDKLYSPAWRSGEAIHYMTSLDYLFNPDFVGIFPSISWINFIISWFVILFEILFAILIWMKPFKKWLLLTGILFHLGIIILLSLVDFGMIMIISYIIFLDDPEWQQLGFGRWMRATPTLS